MFKGLKTIMQADRTESSYLWQAMSESTVTGTARPAMQSWPWRRVQPSTVSPTLLARRSRQWSRAWWPVTAPRSWGRRTTAGLGSHTRKNMIFVLLILGAKKCQNQFGQPNVCTEAICGRRWYMIYDKQLFALKHCKRWTSDVKHCKGWMIWMKHFTIWRLF